MALTTADFQSQYCLSLYESCNKWFQCSRLGEDIEQLDLDLGLSGLRLRPDDYSF